MQWHGGILIQPIPRSGFGRNLTETECQRLRALGYRLSRRWIVVRSQDQPNFGILYYPSKHSNGYSNGGIGVTD